MTNIHIGSELKKPSWPGQGHYVAVWYRVRDYAAVMEAVYAVNIDHLTVSEDDWMVKAYSVSRKQAALLKLFLPHPEDMSFCPNKNEVCFFPIRELPGIVRCLREQVPHSARVMIGRLVLHVDDPITFGVFWFMLESAFSGLAPIRYKIWLDVAQKRV